MQSNGSFAYKAVRLWAKGSKAMATNGPQTAAGLGQNLSWTSRLGIDRLAGGKPSNLAKMNVSCT